MDDNTSNYVFIALKDIKSYLSHIPNLRNELANLEYFVKTGKLIPIPFYHKQLQDLQHLREQIFKIQGLLFDPRHPEPGLKDTFDRVVFAIPNIRYRLVKYQIQSIEKEGQKSIGIIDQIHLFLFALEELSERIENSYNVLRKQLLN